MALNQKIALLLVPGCCQYCAATRHILLAHVARSPTGPTGVEGEHLCEENKWYET